MNTAIVYYSMTGHSKKLAKKMGEALGIKVYSIKDNPQLENIDLLFIVSGIYAGIRFESLVNFTKTLNPEQIKKAAIVTTCCSDRPYQDGVKEELLNKGIEVVNDEIICKTGFLFFGSHRRFKQNIEATIKQVKAIVDSLS